MQGKTRKFLLLLVVLPFLTGFTPLSDKQLDSVTGGFGLGTLLNLFNVVNCMTCFIAQCPDCNPMINNNNLVNPNFFR
jgi:bacteriocin-like protein